MESQQRNIFFLCGITAINLDGASYIHVDKFMYIVHKHDLITELCQETYKYTMATIIESQLRDIFIESVKSLPQELHSLQVWCGMFAL